MDDMVAEAIEQHRAWMASATPSARFQPRVVVEHGGQGVLRRPFKRGGAWFVHWAGTARLTNPVRRGGDIVFAADWGRAMG